MGADVLRSSDGQVVPTNDQVGDAVALVNPGIGWPAVRSIAADHPELGRAFSMLNRAWVLGELAAPTRLRVGDLASSNEVVTRLGTDRRIFEKRYHIGINPEQPRTLRDFGVSVGATPSDTLQPFHFHVDRPEILIPLGEPLVIAQRGPLGSNHESSTVLAPGTFAHIDSFVLHTLVNPSGRPAPHLCVKFPSLLPRDWMVDPAHPGLVTGITIGHLAETGPSLRHHGHEATFYLVDRDRPLAPSARGMLLYALDDTPTDAMDVGSFYVIPKEGTRHGLARLFPNVGEHIIAFESL